MSLEIARIINSPIGSNCFLLFDKDKSNHCIIIDPGSENNKELYSKIDGIGIVPEYIMLTHEHYDHCWGVNDLRDRFPGVKLICSAICSDAIQNERLNYSRYFCKPSFRIEPADILVGNHEMVCNWNGYEFRMIQSKGHSSSGILIIVEKAIFTGDTLIKGVKTVTKFKTGSVSDLKESMDLLSTKQGKGLIIYPGHGEIFQLDKYNIADALGIV